jgi:hypothetical protein
VGSEFFACEARPYGFRGLVDRAMNFGAIDFEDGDKFRFHGSAQFARGGIEVLPYRFGVYAKDCGDLELAFAVEPGAEAKVLALCERHGLKEAIKLLAITEKQFGKGWRSWALFDGVCLRFRKRLDRVEEAASKVVGTGVVHEPAKPGQKFGSWGNDIAVVACIPCGKKRFLHNIFGVLCADTFGCIAAERAIERFKRTVERSFEPVV